MTAKQMLSLLSQLTSDNVLAQPTVLFPGYVTKNQISSTKYLHFQVYGNMIEETRMYQQLQKICREKICRIKVFRTNLRKLGKSILCTPKDLPVPTFMSGWAYK